VEIIGILPLETLPVIIMLVIITPVSMNCGSMSPSVYMKCGSDGSFTNLFRGDGKY
jgi:hypothetical protein